MVHSYNNYSYVYSSIILYLVLYYYFIQREDDIPLVEWWDADLLPSRTYADCDRNLPIEQKYREITNLVEHPIPVDPAGKCRLAIN